MAGDKTPKSQEKRKSSKPLMEKRRRARINECLSELQGILEAVNNSHNETTSSHSKREKAEILEQTVQLVRHLRHQDQTGISSEPLSQAQYRAGFNQCLTEVSRFMEANNSALNPETRTGLLSHLASSVRLSTCYNGWGGQFGQGSSKALPQEFAVNRRQALEHQGCAVATQTAAATQSPHSLVTPPQVSAPPAPLTLAPPTTPSRVPPQRNASTIPIQQSPRKGEHPTAACVPTLTPATPGVTIPVNLPTAPAGHVALVLPAHLLSSFVGTAGSFTTGQVIPLYQSQGGSPVICQQRAASSGMPVPPPVGSDGAGGPFPNSAPGQGSKHENQSANAPSSVGAGQIFIVPSPSFGCAPNTASTAGRIRSSAASSSSYSSSPSLNSGRGGVPVSNPPATTPSMVTMETRNQTGVVYAPASLPMHLYVAPSAYGGGGNYPFTNGQPLPNPSSFGPHWRPWGWDQDQR